MSLEAMKVTEAKRWYERKINVSSHALAIEVANQLLASKLRYQAVETKTAVPWPIIAVIHERESSQSWQASLAQGDPWRKRSIHVPRGRGPFNSWEEAADDALLHCPPMLGHWDDWRIGGALVGLEAYNGYGYYNHGISSPYIWAGTNNYVRGKYIADGHLDLDAVDRQLGCATLLSVMATLDNSIASLFQGFNPS